MTAFCIVLFQLTFSKWTISGIRANYQTIYKIWLGFSTVFMRWSSTLPGTVFKQSGLKDCWHKSNLYSTLPITLPCEEGQI